MLVVVAMLLLLLLYMRHGLTIGTVGPNDAITHKQQREEHQRSCEYVWAWGLGRG